MMVFKKSIPRRTFLRGAGAALALPLLDCMFPAFASAAQTASRKATRLSFFQVPNGIIMDKWTPATVGKIRTHTYLAAAGRLQRPHARAERTWQTTKPTSSNLKSPVITPVHAARI